jgi:hypothetical protein
VLIDAHVRLLAINGTSAVRSLQQSFRHVPFQGQQLTGYAISLAREKGSNGQLTGMLEDECNVSNGSKPTLPLRRDGPLSPSADMSRRRIG